MPGPIFLIEAFLRDSPFTDYRGVPASAVTIKPVDPMNLAAYGISRPHVDGKMAPPGLPWVGKAKGRKRK